MRTSFVLLALACCFVAVVAQADQQQAAPAQAVPVQQQAAPAAPVAAAAAVPVAAAPAPVDLTPLQRDIASLSAAQATAGTEIRSALSANAESVQRLMSTVSEGLAALQTTDSTQTSEVTNSGAEIKQRLSKLEKEVADLKSMLSAYTTSAAASAAAAAASASKSKSGAASDSVLAEIKADQKLILAKLANATAAWQFDHEALLLAAKENTYRYSAELSKFLGRTATNIQRDYPQYLAQAKDLSQQSLEAAAVYGTMAGQHGQVAHIHLSEFLVSKGVPKEFVHYASVSLMSLFALIVAIAGLTLLKSILRCLCCRSGKAVTVNVNKNKNGKGAKPAAMGAGASQ